METEKDDYYSVARRKQVREESRKLRKKYLRYKEAEIVYSIQHKSSWSLPMMQEHFTESTDTCSSTGISSMNTWSSSVSRPRRKARLHRRSAGGRNERDDLDVFGPDG